MLQFFNNIIPHLLPLCIIMLILFIVDLITGVYKAKINNEFSSSKLRAGIPKILLYFCLVIICICIDFIMVFYTNSIEIPIVIQKVIDYYPITTMAKLFIISVEIISNIENLKKAGIEIPQWLITIVDKMRKSTEE